jgi:uncharacterized protein
VEVDLELYRRAVEPFNRELAVLRPEGGEVIDVHTHLGFDEDGRALSVEELLAMMDESGVRRACVFPLHDPERHPAYRVPNDRVLAWAQQSGERLVPFCRLTPTETPVEEGTRALAAGARGIKLHPRAQAFTFDGDHTDQIFALAEEAQVPLLIHAGRGLPPIADGLADVIMRHPGLHVILAHAAITDMGTLTTRLADHPGVLYDTCCMFATDVLDLFSRVAPERVVFGSDPPYGHPLPGQYMALRVAAASGLDDGLRRLVLGDTVAQMVDHGTLPERSDARGDGMVQLPAPLVRVQTYAAMVVPWLFMGNVEMARAGIDMSLAVCRDPHAGSAAPALELIGQALAAVRELLGAGPQGFRPAIDLLHRSIAHASTERL